jgi:hypothetical protein
MHIGCEDVNWLNDSELHVVAPFGKSSIKTSDSIIRESVKNTCRIFTNSVPEIRNLSAT